MFQDKWAFGACAPFSLEQKFKTMTRKFIPENYILERKGAKMQRILDSASAEGATSNRAVRKGCYMIGIEWFERYL